MQWQDGEEREPKEQTVASSGPFPQSQYHFLSLIFKILCSAYTLFFLDIHVSTHLMFSLNVCSCLKFSFIPHLSSPLHLHLLLSHFYFHSTTHTPTLHFTVLCSSASSVIYMWAQNHVLFVSVFHSCQQKIAHKQKHLLKTQHKIFFKGLFLQLDYW